MTATTTATATRKKLRQLVNQIPESELYAAMRYLEYLVVPKENPVLRVLKNAPVSDPLEDEIEALREADEAEARGAIVSHEEARRILLRDT